jgi:hypothetical protein
MDSKLIAFQCFVVSWSEDEILDHEKWFASRLDAALYMLDASEHHQDRDLVMNRFSFLEDGIMVEEYLLSHDPDLV